MVAAGRSRPESAGCNPGAATSASSTLLSE